MKKRQGEIKKGWVYFIPLLMLLSGFLSAQDHFILGYSEDELLVMQPSQVQEGPDGNIYVYDEKDAFIKVFSTSGALIKKMGGLDEGPGYIKRTDGVTFGFTADKLLFFTEYFTGHRWVTFLNLDGSLNKTVLPVMKETFYGVSRAISLPDGSFIISIDYLGTPKKTSRYFLLSSPKAVLHMGVKGNILSSIKKTEYYSRMSYIHKGADIEIPFVPNLIWRPYKNGILFTDGINPVLQWVDYKGNNMGTINTMAPTGGEVSSEDLQNWKKRVKERFYENARQKEWYDRHGKVIEEYNAPLYTKIAAIRNLSVTPAGNILLTLPLKDPILANLFRLINHKGKTLAEVQCVAWDIHFSPHFVFAYKRDEEGTTMVYCFKRSGDEVMDLKKFSQVLQ